MTPAEHTAQRWLETRAPFETHQLGDVVVFEGATMTVTAVIAGRAVSVGPPYPRDPGAPALDVYTGGPAMGQKWSAGSIDHGGPSAAPGIWTQRPAGAALAEQTAWANGVQSGLAAASCQQNPPAPPLTPAQRYRLVEIAHETTDPAIRAAALGLLGGGP